jgi:hypothetical protein
MLTEEVEVAGGGAAGRLQSCKGQLPSRSKGKVKSDRAKKASPFEAEEVEVAGSLHCS